MAGKPIRIGGHARWEMKRRGISVGEVLRTIRTPGQVLAARKGRHVFQSLHGRAGRLLLRVIVKEDASAYHVVTAYKTSKVSKYWRSP